MAKAARKSGKNVDQKTRKFVRLTDAAIENHLLGNQKDRKRNSLSVWDSPSLIESHVG